MNIGRKTYDNGNIFGGFKFSKDKNGNIGIFLGKWW